MDNCIVPCPGKKATDRDKSRPPFAPVPKSLMSRKDVSQSAKLLYGLILSLSCETGYSYAGDDYLAEAIGVSRRQVQRAIVELHELKVIRFSGATSNRHIHPLYERAIISKANRAERLASETAQAAPEHAPLVTGDAPELAPSPRPTCDENGAYKKLLKEKKKKEETTATPPQRERAQPNPPPPQSFSSSTIKSQEKEEPCKGYLSAARAGKAMLAGLEKQRRIRESEALKAKGEGAGR